MCVCMGVVGAGERTGDKDVRIRMLEDLSNYRHNLVEWKEAECMGVEGVTRRGRSDDWVRVG